MTHNRRTCGISYFTLAAQLSLHLAEASQSLSRERRVTRLASSSKSRMRKSARPCPITTSGSGATESVPNGPIIDTQQQPLAGAVIAFANAGELTAGERMEGMGYADKLRRSGGKACIP